MGLFDQLFGAGAPAAPGAPPAPGFGDRLMNPMAQMGLALLANHGTPTAQRGMFDGVGEAGIRAQVYGDAKRQKAEERAEKNRTLEFLRQNHPDIAGLVDGGLDVGEAFNYALQRQNVAADNARADRAFGLQQAEIGREQAGWNATAKYLESQGADPSLVDLARSGQGSAAFSMFNAGRGLGGELPTSIQEIQAREQLAPSYNLDPQSPEGRAFVLTGKLPSADRTVTSDDRRAIREADDAVLSAEQADISLQRALKLSEGAMEGAGAGMRASIGNNLPDLLVPDFIASPEASQATVELDNTVTESALQQMKSIFGAAPTEGERQILLDIQGASSQPRAVRERIYARAREAVARRLEYNKDRATELRGGTYYDARPAPGRAPSAAAGAVPAGVDPEDWQFMSPEDRALFQ